VPENRSYTAVEVRKILEANKEKDFVSRVLDPVNSPSVDLGGGFTGTHLMAADWDDEGKRWLVYPTIVRISGNLEKLDPEDAFHHAKSTGEYIDFGDKKDAAINFSKDYKKVWKQGEDGEVMGLVDGQ
jgi:hypothetical protein